MNISSVGNEIDAAIEGMSVSEAAQYVPAQYIELLCGESDANQSPGDKVFLITRSSIVDLRMYVGEARLLPVDLNKIQEKLGYKEVGVPELEPVQIQKFNQAVVQHADSWTTLETETKELARQLDTYAGKFLGAGNRLLSIIDKVDTGRFFDGTIEELTEEELEEFAKITLDDNQKKRLGAIQEYLKVMSDMTVSYVDKTMLVSRLAAQFERTLTDELIPQVQLKTRAYKESALSNDISDLLEEVAALDALIETLAQTYDAQVGYAFTGLFFGPLGLIVTGGIFGSMAEDTRKAKNKAIEQRKEVQRKIERAENILILLSAAHTQFASLRGTMLAAEVGAKQLAQVWQYIYKYLEEAAESLGQVDNFAKLHSFALKFTMVLKPWEQIGDYAEQISKAFNDAVE